VGHGRIASSHVLTKLQQLVPSWYKPFDGSVGFKRMKKDTSLDSSDIDRIIEMAWEDRTPFDAITHQFMLSEKEVIDLMRKEMTLSSFKMWRKRVQGRSTKHTSLSQLPLQRFKCSRQRNITGNKISKRN